MKMQDLRKTTLREFVARVLPSLTKAELDDFCHPGKLEASRLFACHPFNTTVFLHRRENGVTIDLKHNGKTVSVRAQYDSNPYDDNDMTGLPDVWLNGIYLGEDGNGPTRYNHAFYPEWSKPKLANTFRARVIGGHKLKRHKLDDARLNETGRAIDHVCLQLSAKVAPKMDIIAPVFTTNNITPLPALGSAARMRRIRSARAVK